MKLLKKLVVAAISISMCALTPMVVLADNSDPCGCAADLNNCETIAGNNHENCTTNATNNFENAAAGCLLFIFPWAIVACEGVNALAYKSALETCNNTYDTDIANCQSTYQTCEQKCGA
jgi:hypothetical protein